MLRALYLTLAIVAAPQPAHSGGLADGSVAVKAEKTTTGMVRIPAGSYRPLYGRKDDPRVKVSAFMLDTQPVTRGEFLEFVRENPSWRRSNVRPVFAERGYLGNWRGDVDAGNAAELDLPVTSVSWFAAKAYCSARGKRLPTVNEWEYAAAASATEIDAARDPKFIRQLLTLYAERPHGDALAPAGHGFRNVYGVRDLHGAVSEWTLDFNGVIVSDDSREAGSGVGQRNHSLFCAGATIGATDPTNYPAFMRYAFRAGLTGRSTVPTLGFRCAAG